MRGSSPEINAAKSKFLLIGIASRLVPGLCTAEEAGLAAWGGRTFSEHLGVAGQHLRVLFCEAGLPEYRAQRQRWCGCHKSSYASKVLSACRGGFHLQTSLVYKASLQLLREQLRHVRDLPESAVEAEGSFLLLVVTCFAGALCFFF